MARSSRDLPVARGEPRGPGARVALAALTLAVLAAMPAPARAIAVTCAQLEAEYALSGGPARALSVRGRAVPVGVYWDGRAPSRAAAALLAAALRHAARIRPVRLRNASLCHLLRTLPALENALHYDVQEVVLMPDSAWGAEEAACALAGAGGGGAAPARLRVLGAGAPPPRLRLRALVPASPSPLCRNRTLYLFYTDKEHLMDCGFYAGISDGTSSMAFYYPKEWKEAAEAIADQAMSAGVRLHRVPLAGGARSAPAPSLLPAPALLLDYELRAAGAPALPVLPPPNAPPALDQHNVRAADETILRAVAPNVLRLFQQFKPKVEELREVLDSDADIEEAACAWVANSENFRQSFKFAFDRTFNIYEVAIFLCEDDPDRNEYVKAVNEILVIIRRQTDSERSEFRWNALFVDVRCNDEHSLLQELSKRVQSEYWARLVGAVGAGAGVRAAAAAARALDTALVAYDVPLAPLASPARAVSATLAHLALALRHFVSAFGWSRLVLISDDTRLAINLVDLLRDSLKIKNVKMKPVELALGKVREIDGRIIFVNSDASAAMSVLCAAHAAGMSADAGYVWIVREWHALNMTCANTSAAGEPLVPFTVSFWRRGAVRARGGAGERARCAGGVGGAVAGALQRRWAGRAWPLRAAPLADALLLLLHSFQLFLRKHPERETDLHGGNATGLLWENVEEICIEGVTQNLELNKQGLVSPFVFVDRWNGSKQEQIAVWQIQSNTVNTIMEYINAEQIFRGKIPSDGTISCFSKTVGDEFVPLCYDTVLWSVVGATLVALPALCAARRARRERLARRDRQRAAGLLQRGERAAAALAPLLVDRALLDARHELGSGRFGRVRFAMLRKPGRSSTPVAVKALRDDVSPAEEREFLNEACMLASLRHRNIVRLVGVCAVGGPPLVLMEHAFFGDLQRYLKERRHLVGGGDGGGEDEQGTEARHVAAPALTRLGREAAAALEFLAEQRVVHRDVRASNCLVDAHRTLKLGDFGMARRADVGAEGEAEYECRRRGLFPVLWMAPESLERGVFTAASDAWALGVLLLELVTLGARPYAAWSPLRVMRYVSAGGRPPLPADISPETRGLLAACWRRAAGERAGAGEVRARLDAAPALLRPARAPPPAPDTDHTITTREPER